MSFCIIDQTRDRYSIKKEQKDAEGYIEADADDAESFT